MLNPEAQEILPESLQQGIAESIREHVRMPFSNNWRVDVVDANGIKGLVSRDCLECTTPTYSAENGVEIADRLYANGAQVYGWDLEWTGGWGGAGTETADEFMAKMKAAESDLLLPGKIMILAHDHIFTSPDELYKFFVRALREGYEFRTVDSYGTD